MSIFEPYELIRIISLPHRTDRRREMREQLRKVGLDGDPRVAFVDAIRPEGRGDFASIGAHGCFLSHLKALQEAAGQSVLVLEDDCDFYDAALTATVPDGADLFYGGYTRFGADDLSTDNVFCAHCVGFSARAGRLAADYLASFFDDRFRPDEKALADKQFDGVTKPPVDGAYSWFRRAHPELRVVLADPIVAVQRPSRTDIADRPFYDRVPGLRALAATARRFKRTRPPLEL